MHYSQNKKWHFHSVNAHIRFTPAQSFFSGRADNACTNLLGFFVRYVRTRGIAVIVEDSKTTDFYQVICRTHCHAWLVRLTRARRTRFGRRTAQVLLADFWYFSSSKSTLIKSILKYFSGHRNATPYKRYSSSTVHTKKHQKNSGKHKSCRSFSSYNLLFIYPLMLSDYTFS